MTSFSVGSGRWSSADRLLDEWDDVLAALRAQAVPITHRVALRGCCYVSSHRDPFDRLLAAEAELSGVGLITVDTAFAGFPVRVVW